MTAWLEALQLPIQPDPPDAATVTAVRAWNMMGGTIDWNALDAVCELIGIGDVDCLLAQLEAIRNHGQ